MQNALNERIKELRSFLELSQNDFASKIGVSAVGVWKMEQGESKPRKTTLNAIITQFGVSEDWLINGVGEFSVNVPTEQPKATNKTVEVLESKVEHLEKEIVFYRDLLMSLSHKVAVNFNDAFGLAGHEIVGKFKGKTIEMFTESVRVAS